MNIKSKFGDYSATFDSLKELINREHNLNKAYIIDRNVYNLHNEKFADINEDYIYLFDAFEKNKNPNESFKIIDFFEKKHVDKSWKIYVIGGGITQEVSGFACCIFLRGLKWILCPTTLLSMSDSCIGGKCGLNYDNVKNRIGVFYPPSDVIIDTSFLSTLSRERIIDGEGEIIKSCLLSAEYHMDAFLFSEDNIAEYIKKALKVKKDIIEKDELECGSRMLLNFGHTFGHALESYTDHKISHGKAVFWGMDISLYISMQKGYISESNYFKAHSLIKSIYNYDIKIDNCDNFLDFIKKDKKSRGKYVFFILLKGFGNPYIENIEVNSSLKRFFMDWLNKNML